MRYHSIDDISVKYKKIYIFEKSVAQDVKSNTINKYKCGNRVYTTLYFSCLNRGRMRDLCASSQPGLSQVKKQTGCHNAFLKVISYYTFLFLIVKRISLVAND